MLVVGSGMLRFLRFGPFADWSALMREVASHLGVDHDDALSKHQPIVYWEHLLAKAAAASGRPAGELEASAQRHDADGRVFRKRFLD